VVERSPFDALEPMLATEGMENRARGYELFFQPFTLTPTSVAGVRQRILDLAFHEIESPDLRRAVRAADVLQHALRYPHGYFGQEVDESVRNAWTPEFVSTLDRLAVLVAERNLDPVVIIAIRQAIRWHVNYSKTETGSAARRVRDAIPAGPDHDLTLALYDGWGRLSDDEFGRDYERAMKVREERANALARQLTESLSDEVILGQVDERLSALAALPSARGNAGPFVWALVTARPSLGTAVAARVAADPGSGLAQVLAVTLAALAEHAPTEVIDAIDPLLAIGDLTVRREVAQAFGWNRGGSRSVLIPGELDLLLRLAGDRDDFVRTCAIRAAQRLAPHRPDAALNLLVSVRFADSTTVADQLFQALGPHGELDWRQLPTGQMERFLAELEACPSIEDHGIMTFLADLSGEEPDDVVRLLQRRVQHSEQPDVDSDYRPLPFTWGEELKVRETPQFPTILRHLRLWIAQRADSWHRREAGAELFETVAGVFDDTVMAILEEGANTGDDNEMIAVAAILRKVPPYFPFDEVDFVRRILATAASRSQEHLQRVGSALTAAAVSGVRMGTPGQPFTEDLEQRDRARKTADKMLKGSHEERLYRGLERSAEDNILWHAERDDLLDGRDW
jgi:hypothetical protein